MTWRIGSKVTCIRDSFFLPECVMNPPKKGEVYVVRAVCDNGVPLIEHVIFVLLGANLPGLMLREISNPPCDCRGGIERGFDQSAFRPVIEDETKFKAEVEALKQVALEAVIKTPEKVR